MNQRLFLSCICLLILVSFVAVPVLAATVTCPSSCSCLLPAEAKKGGYPGYCGDKQAVCGFDQQKNEKYCYEKPVTITVPQLIITAKPFVTTTVTTAPVPATCPTGCSCYTLDEGKQQGYSLCGNKMTLCGYGTNQQPKYCHQPPVTVTTTTTAPSSLCPASCTCTIPEKAAAAGLSLCGKTKTSCGSTPSGITQYCYVLPTTVTITTTLPVVRVAAKSCTGTCTCLATDKADASGFKRCSDISAPCDYDPLGRPMYCYVADRVTRVSPVPATTTTTPAPGGSVAPIRMPVTAAENTPASSPGPFAAISSFFATLFGGRGATGAGSGTGTIMACPFGLTLCDGQCVDLKNDTMNCGRCRGFCYGQLTLCCNGTCSTMFSAENCGSCGNSCAAIEPCTSVGGWLTCSADGCDGTARSTDCGTGVCVDLSLDSANCGSCGHACPDHSQCVSSVCTPCPEGSDRCGTGALAGGGICQNTESYPFACGGCGIVCDPDKICEGGICVPCPAGETRCGISCTNLQSGGAFCGSCMHRCPDGETCCNGECTNFLFNNTNCGSCGHACSSSQVCSSGTCVSGYGSGDCVGPTCNGRCVDYRTDRGNCGRCGHACPDYFTCRESTCTPFYTGDDTVCAEPGLDYCNGDCIDLQTSEQHCGRCGNGCVGEICCNGVCTDYQNDPDNCGSCGNHCAAGQVCCNGRCQTDRTGEPDTCGSCGRRCVGEGLGCCNGYCWDLANDKMNCGSCGNVCTGESECCGGRCVNTRWDEDNCGSCSRHCPWNKECQNGLCCLWGTTWGCD